MFSIDPKYPKYTEHIWLSSDLWFHQQKVLFLYLYLHLTVFVAVFVSVYVYSLRYLYMCLQYMEWLSSDLSIRSAEGPPQGQPPIWYQLDQHEHLMSNVWLILYVMCTVELIRKYWQVFLVRHKCSISTDLYIINDTHIWYYVEVQFIQKEFQVLCRVGSH